MGKMGDTKNETAQNSESITPHLTLFHFNRKYRAIETIENISIYTNVE